MKIKIHRQFQYQDGPRKVITLAPGVYDLDKRIAGLALRWGKAELIVEKKVEKKAPENKVADVPENKASVAKKTVRRRRTRSKSDT